MVWINEYEDNVLVTYVEYFADGIWAEIESKTSKLLYIKINKPIRVLAYHILSIRLQIHILKMWRYICMANIFEGTILAMYPNATELCKSDIEALLLINAVSLVWLKCVSVIFVLLKRTKAAPVASPHFCTPPPMPTSGCTALWSHIVSIHHFYTENRRYFRLVIYLHWCSRKYTCN